MKKVLSLAVALIMIFVLISMISGQTEMFKHIIISLQKVKRQLLFLGQR